MGEPEPIAGGAASPRVRRLTVQTRLSLVFAAGLVAAYLCSSCRHKPEPRKVVSEDSPPEIPPGTLPPAWHWELASASSYSMPAGCALAAPPKRYATDTARLLFVAAAGDLDTVATVTSSADSPITSERGLIQVAAPSRRRDIPWLQTTAPPVMAAASGKWLAVLSQPEALGPLVRLWLWREGRPMERIAEGDQLTVADARCAGATCALLTTRPTGVASPGATVWMGGFDDPIATWTRYDAASGLEGARPLSLSGYDGDTAQATIAVETADRIVFYRVSTAGVRDAGSVVRDGTLIDTSTVRDGPTAWVASGRVLADGCVPEGVRLRARMPGRDTVEVSPPDMPESGYARQVGQGAFVSWISRVNCKDPRRKVVNALLTSPSGKPGAVMTIGDADGYALSTSGAEVVLWLRDPQGVTMLRGSCVPAD